MRWRKSNQCDPLALPLANRHYNRQTITSPQFCPPGRMVVLITGDPVSALWVSNFQRYTLHAWPGAWVNSLFRNEGSNLSSELIREAMSATRAAWGCPPPEGLISFVDPRRIQSSNPGYCFQCAGFRRVGNTASGKLVLHIAPSDMPDAEPALGSQLQLWNPTWSESAARSSAVRSIREVFK